jgi:MraZ protein
VVFIGEYRGKIDDKGRIVIPAKLRKVFFDAQVYSVFLTRGLENCMFLFPEKDWNVQTEKLKSLPFTKIDPRSFTRLFFSGAFQSRIDRQGRIGLPQNLIIHAQLKEDFVIIGAGDRLEIWAADTWDKYYSEAMNSYGKTAETLLGQG